MDATSVGRPVPPAGGIRHEAFLYREPGEWVRNVCGFVRDGLAADESVMVAVPAEKLSALRDELGADHQRVRLVDMADVGRNPARIIPAWQQFVQSSPDGRGTRGVGEPVWPGRRPVEIVECDIHEALLNLAFASVPRFWLRCPYDAGRLDPLVIDRAGHTHQLVTDAGGHPLPRPTGAPSAGDRCGGPRSGGPGSATDTLSGALPEPADVGHDSGFPRDGLPALRHAVAEHAARAGFSAQRCADATLAVDELASNSLRYGGGHGRLRIWREPNALVCEVRDRGLIHDPLVGRRMPTVHQEGGRGLWLANQLCDLVQVRSSATGTTVRVHLRH